MGGTAEVRNVNICVQFLTCCLLVPAITANLVWIPFMSCDGLILTVCYRNAILYLIYKAK
jgi:hypothetical protein